MPLSAVTDFKDHNKQKDLVVMVVLPTGVMQYNATNTDILVSSAQDALIVKIIWPHNMIYVKTLLG